MPLKFWNFFWWLLTYIHSLGKICRMKIKLFENLEQAKDHPYSEYLFWEQIWYARHKAYRIRSLMLPQPSKLILFIWGKSAAVSWVSSTPNTTTPGKTLGQVLFVMSLWQLSCFHDPVLKQIKHLGHNSCLASSTHPFFGALSKRKMSSALNNVQMYTPFSESDL